MYVNQIPSERPSCCLNLFFGGKNICHSCRLNNVECLFRGQGSNESFKFVVLSMSGERDPVLFCDGTSRYGVPENLTTG